MLDTLLITLSMQNLTFNAGEAPEEFEGGKLLKLLEFILPLFRFLFWVLMTLIAMH